MTDNAGYTDQVFGLFRLLGYQFSPRLADLGDARFWRTNLDADYGPLNGIARHRVNTDLIARSWDDLLRVAGSLFPPEPFAPAKSSASCKAAADPPLPGVPSPSSAGSPRPSTCSLTSTTSPTDAASSPSSTASKPATPSPARSLSHGQRGQLRQRYREGQEDQLGALGLALNAIVLWNTRYLDAALAQLRREGYPIEDADVERLSPLIHDHINLLGRYHFTNSDRNGGDQLRPLRDPRTAADG